MRTDPKHQAAIDEIENGEPGAPNLDHATESEDTLMTYWHVIHCHPVRTARRLFPARLRGYVSATHALGAYASNKSAAIACRRRGDIKAAGVYETICDRIYSELPSFARW